MIRPHDGGSDKNINILALKRVDQNIGKFFVLLLISFIKRFEIQRNLSKFQPSVLGFRTAAHHFRVLEQVMDRNNFRVRVSASERMFFYDSRFLPELRSFNRGTEPRQPASDHHNVIVFIYLHGSPPHREITRPGNSYYSPSALKASPHPLLKVFQPRR